MTAETYRRWRRADNSPKRETRERRPSALANEIHARRRSKTQIGKTLMAPMADRHRHRCHCRRNSRERSCLSSRYNCATAGSPRGASLIRENKDLSEPKSSKVTMCSTEPVFRGHVRLLINLSLVSVEKWEARNKIYRWPQRRATAVLFVVEATDYGNFNNIYVREQRAR